VQWVKPAVQYSDETAKTIDEEVRRIIENQYEVALTILKANRDLLVETVGQLLTDEVIEGDALNELAEAVRHAKSMDDSTKTGSPRRNSNGGMTLTGDH
jgi:ATP-dependent Zn protease